MKFTVTLLALFMLLCSLKDLIRFIPEEFEYPLSKIGAGKTFVYKDSGSNHYSFQDVRLAGSKGCYTVKQYDAQSAKDSMRFCNRKITEQFNFFMAGNGTVTKGDDLLDTIVQSNGKYGKRLIKITHRTPQFTFTTQGEQNYIKDTIINWQGKPLPCIVTQATGTVVISLSSASASQATRTITNISTYYNAKGMGVIRSISEAEDHSTGEKGTTIQTLEAIRDIQ